MPGGPRSQRLNAIGFDGATEQLAGAEDVLLADELVEGARAHAGGEGAGDGGAAPALGPVCWVRSWGGEEVGLGHGMPAGLRVREGRKKTPP